MTGRPGRLLVKFFGAFLLLGGAITAFGFTGPLILRLVGGVLVSLAGVATLLSLAQNTTRKTAGVAVLAFLLLAAGANIAPEQPETDSTDPERAFEDAPPQTTQTTSEYGVVTEDSEYGDEDDDDVNIYVHDDSDYGYSSGCNNDGDQSYDEDNDRDNDGICDEG